MEYQTEKSIFRIVKRTYSDETIKFIIQFKRKVRPLDEWSDLYIRFATLEKARESVDNLVKAESPEKYKDEVV